MTRSGRVRRRSLLLGALSLLLVACRGSEPSVSLPVHDTGVKVLLVGIDGATFTVMDPLLAAGELPTFRRLIARGARGALESERPMKSPALWTTLATGHRRQDHGIEQFTVEDPARGRKILVNSTLRRRLALWNILGAAERSVGVAGWWATWPAEPVRGWLVSDRMTRSRWSEWFDGSQEALLTYPERLAEELRPLVVDPLQPPLDEIRDLVQLTAEEEREFLAARRPVWAHSLSVLKFAYCTQRSYERIALHLLARGQPDFTALFLIANDPISHTFWHYHDPAAYDFAAEPFLPHRAAAVANIYRHNDAFVARLEELVDESTVILVVSDHGFRASGKLPEKKPLHRYPRAFSADVEETAEADGTVTVGQTGVHELHGLLVASGGPIRPGTRVEATLYDVAPTVLALMGLPVPEDLPGRVLEELLEPGFLARFPVRRLPSYEGLVERGEMRLAPGDERLDDETLEMLRALGYIQ